MKIEILENNNIIIEKNDTYYLIKKFRISGTFIDNYAIYSDYNNDIDYLKNAEEEELCYETETATLEEALLFIKNYEEC